MPALRRILEATVSYDISGNVTSSVTNGVSTTATNSSMYSYAAPSQLTNSSSGMSSLTTNLTFSTFLALNGESGPNQDSASISFDSNARPGTAYSPYGAQTTYTYNDTASPPTKTATTNGH